MTNFKIDFRISWRLLMLALVYYMAALAGLLLLSETNNIALIWPATAVLIVYLYNSDISSWPLAILISWAAGIFANITLATGLPYPVVLALTFTDVFLDGLLAVALMRWFGGRQNPFSSIAELLRFITFACVIAPAVGGVAGASTLVVESQQVVHIQPCSADRWFSI